MNRLSPQYGNYDAKYGSFELALQPMPAQTQAPGGPTHDVHIEGEKTEQKAIQRLVLLISSLIL